MREGQLGRAGAEKCPSKFQSCPFHQNSFSQRQETQALLGPDPPPYFPEAFRSGSYGHLVLSGLPQYR